MPGRKTIDDETVCMLTPSEVIEFLYCKRFIYFMHCLQIRQHEERRFKVQKGRDIHKIKADQNKNYVRQKIGCLQKEENVYLAAVNYQIRGIVDEVLYLEDGSMAPFDYKFAVYSARDFATLRIQSTLYALLIREVYQKPVYKGFICYIRSNHQIVPVIYEDKDFTFALKCVDDILRIIQTGFFPGKTKWRKRCIDCCYRNICV